MLAAFCLVGDLLLLRLLFSVANGVLDDVAVGVVAVPGVRPDDVVAFPPENGLVDLDLKKAADCLKVPEVIAEELLFSVVDANSCGDRDPGRCGCAVSWSSCTLPLPTLDALDVLRVDDPVGPAAVGGVEATVSRMSSALPIFSNMALAVLNLAL